jgi:hypothetical protein
MIKKSKANGNFDIIFEKLAQMGEPKQEVSDLVNESSAISKLREMILEVNEENEGYFSTT